MYVLAVVPVFAHLDSRAAGMLIPICLGLRSPLELGSLRR